MAWIYTCGNTLREVRKAAVTTKCISLAPEKWTFPNKGSEIRLFVEWGCWERMAFCYKSVEREGKMKNSESCIVRERKRLCTCFVCLYWRVQSCLSSPSSKLLASWGTVFLSPPSTLHNFGVNLSGPWIYYHSVIGRYGKSYWESGRH